MTKDNYYDFSLPILSHCFQPVIASDRQGVISYTYQTFHNRLAKSREGLSAFFNVFNYTCKEEGVSRWSESVCRASRCADAARIERVESDAWAGRVVVRS